MNILSKRVLYKRLWLNSRAYYSTLRTPFSGLSAAVSRHRCFSYNNAFTFTYYNRRWYNAAQVQANGGKYYWEEEEQTTVDPQASKFTHKSNAQELIASMPVIEVDTDVVRCTGVNELGYGHPVQYIALNTRRRHVPNKCKYWGLRFVKRGYLKD